MAKTKNRTKARRKPVRQMSGPKNLYRGKNRKPLSFVMTDPARAVLAHHVKRTGMSRSDYLQTLVVSCGHLVKPAPRETHGQDAPAAEQKSA